MNTSDPKFSDQDLQRYVDGELDAARRKALEAYLANDPGAAQKVARLQALNQGLRQLFDPVLEEPVPTRLQPAVKMGQGARRPSWLQAAVIATLMLGSGSIGWWLGTSLSPAQPVAGNNSAVPVLIEESLVRPALVSYRVYTPEVLHPVEVSREQQQHLAHWLSKRLGATLRIPELQSVGFELMGGRLLPGEPRPAAQFMYENAHGQRLTLYVRYHPQQWPQTAFRHTESDGVRTFYWIDNGLGYALSAALDKTTLWQVAESIYRQLAF